MRIKFFVIVFCLMFFLFLSQNASAETPGLKITLDKSSPASTDVLPNQTWPLAVFNFNNTACSDVTKKVSNDGYIVGLTFHITGSADFSAIKSVQLIKSWGDRATFDEYDQQNEGKVLASAPVNPDGSVVFSSIAIPFYSCTGAGVGWQIFSLQVNAVLSDSVKDKTNLGIAINSPNDISSVVTAVGSFPVSGNLMNVVNSPSDSTDQPSIALSFPVGGENWQWGNTYKIAWNAVNVNSDVNISLINDITGETQNIAGPISANVGAYSLYIPKKNPNVAYQSPFLAGDKYKIKVGNSQVSSISNNYFSITDPGSDWITITSPKAGDILKAGQTFDIKWNTGLGGNLVKYIGILSYDGDSDFFPIYKINVSGLGPVTNTSQWFIGQKAIDQSQSVGMLRIDDGFFDPPPVYNIYNKKGLKAKAGHLLFKVPSNVSFLKNSRIVVVTDNNDMFVPGVIAYSGPISIVSCVPNWQCGNWSACFKNKQTRSCPDLNKCGIKAGAPATQQNCDSTQPYIKLTSPNGGETWQTGKKYNIKWQSGNLSKVSHISITTSDANDFPANSTLTYDLFWDGALNPKTGSWAVPISSSSSYHKYNKITITGVSAAGTTVEDSSDNPFIIINAPGKTSKTNGNIFSSISAALANLFGK